MTMRDHPYQEFEQEVAKVFNKLGLQAKTMTTNNPGFDVLITEKNGNSIAVQCRDWKAPLTVATIQAFYYFLDSNPNYQEGIIVAGDQAKKPYAKTVDLLLAEDENREGFFEKISLAVLKNGVLYSYPDLKPIGDRVSKEKIEVVDPQRIEPEAAIPLSIAVCALKGGVGKTTISAHLAGAITLSGLNVVLVDANPPQNSLINLMDPMSLDKNGKYHPDFASGIVLPGVPTAIDCYPLDYWKEVVQTNKRGIVYDCAPSIEANDHWVFKNSDICLIPLNINPLGIGKGLAGGRNTKSSLQQTIEFVRNINPKIKFYIVESNRFNQAADTKKGETLRNQVSILAREFDVKLLDTFIPNSRQLYFWGDQPGKLAFETFGGKCLPKLAFSSLAEELMEELKQTDLSEKVSVYAGAA
jgi:chromosome partitioning protein